MTAAPTLKLVPDSHVTDTIKEIAAELAADAAGMIKAGAREAELLPPDTEPRYNDLANSDRFLAAIGDEMLYCPESKKWMIWQGTHWQEDRDDFAFAYAKAFARGLYADARDKAALQNADRANNAAGFNAFLGLSQRNQTAPINTFDDKDATGYLLNCKNGTLDLKSGGLFPHDRKQRITRIVNCEYDADATSTVFDRFLATIQPDPAIRAFLQRSIGYSLLGTVRERSFWILYGTGNNGKSIFTNLFNNLLGEYASTTTTASIMAGKQNAIPNDIARLKGKRFIVVPETEENERINAALVKALSAGDKVTARFLFAEHFDFYFSGKLWIATNHKPTVTDHSKGFWHRVKLVPFAQDIPADQVIKSDDLMRQLMADAPAVLAWAVQGARDYFELDGLDVPPVIQAEIDAYKYEQDSIAQFINECCETIEDARERNEHYVIEANYRVDNTELFKAYVRFCENTGEYKWSQRRLTRNMKERGFRQINAAGRYWAGIRLIDTSG